MLADLASKSVDHHLYSDATGSFGCGAMWARAWFQLQWPKDQSIAVKELLSIVMACILWGKEWQNTSVLAHCDNQVVVEMVNSGYSKDTELMQLLRCLFFCCCESHVGVNIEGGSYRGPAEYPSRCNFK